VLCWVLLGGGLVTGVWYCVGQERLQVVCFAPADISEVGEDIIIATGLAW